MAQTQRKVKTTARAAAKKQSVATALANSIMARSTALGASNTTMLDVVSTLVCQHARNSDKAVREIAEAACLSPATVHRMVEYGDSKKPEMYRVHMDSIERVLKALGAEVHFKEVSIQKRYMPKEKV